MADEGFLSRWSRLKAQSRSAPANEDASAVAAPTMSAPGSPVTLRVPGEQSSAGPAPGAQQPVALRRADAAVPEERQGLPQPTLADALRLDASSDYSAFVARGVDKAVRRAALRRLFADPHFNTMDGLDVYIGDYTKPDPVAPAMLASLRRAAGLLRDEPREPGEPAHERAATEPRPGTIDAAPPHKENDEH